MGHRGMRWVLVLGALLVQAASAAESGAPKVSLKQQYPAGSYVMTTTMSGDQSMSVDGQPQPAQEMKQTFVVTMDVGEPDPAGVRTMQMAFSHVKQDITVGPQVMSYDSQGPADKQDPNLSRAMGPVTKAKIAVKIGADGKVVGASGMDEMWDAMAKETPEMAGFARQMKGQMGDATIVDMVAKPSQMLPSGPVGPGDAWEPSIRINVPGIGELQVKQFCKLVSVEKTPAGSVAVIDYEGTAQSEKETTANMGVAGLKIRSAVFKQSGQMRFNVDTGMVERK